MMIRFRSVRRKRYPSVIAILFILGAVGILGGRYIYNEYDTYYRSEVREYETISEARGPWLLETERKLLLGKYYAGFVVKDGESGEVLYRCPDLYPVGGLRSIRWDGDEHDIAVESDGQTVIYREADGRWEKTEP